MATTNGFSTAMSIGQSVFSIIASHDMTVQKGKYALNEQKRLQKIYEENLKALEESYIRNWYRGNVMNVETRMKIIDEYAQEKGDLLAQLSFVDNANNVVAGSYMNDSKNLVDSMKDQDLMRTQRTYMVNQEERLNEFVKNETSLTDDLAYQTKALAEQFQQIRNQDQMNTVTQLMGMLDAGGSYGVDKLFDSDTTTTTGNFETPKDDNFKLYIKGGNVYAVKSYE